MPEKDEEPIDKEKILLDLDKKSKDSLDIAIYNRIRKKEQFAEFLITLQQLFIVYDGMVQVENVYKINHLTLHWIWLLLNQMVKYEILTRKEINKKKDYYNRYGFYVLNKAKFLEYCKYAKQVLENKL